LAWRQADEIIFSGRIADQARQLTGQYDQTRRDGGRPMFSCRNRKRGELGNLNDTLQKFTGKSLRSFNIRITQQILNIWRLVITAKNGVAPGD